MTPDQVPDDAAERFAELAWGGNPPLLPAVLDRAKRYIALAHNVMSTNPKPEPTEETHVFARFAAGVDASGTWDIYGSAGLPDPAMEDRVLTSLGHCRTVMGEVWLPRPVTEQVQGKVVQEGRVDE